MDKLPQPTQVHNDMKEWVRIRDKALSELDIDYGRKMLPKGASDAVILAAMHKARYEATGIDPNLRHESRRWLELAGMVRIGQLPFPENREELPQ